MGILTTSWIIKNFVEKNEENPSLTLTRPIENKYDKSFVLLST